MPLAKRWGVLTRPLPREQPGTWVTEQTDDMGNTIPVLFRSGIAVAEAVDPVGKGQPCPQIHARCVLVFAGGRLDAQ